MESIEVFQKTYGASYNEARRLSEIKNCRYTIWIVTSINGGGNMEIQSQWSGLRLHQLTRFSWYFRYRAALVQIKYPKTHVYFSINKTYETTDQRTDLIQTLKNKLTNAKAKLTQATMKVNAIKERWSKLFPIEDDPEYIKIIAELEKRKQRIHELESDMAQTEHENIFDLLQKHHII